ncbi:DUF1947 domain-containing protein [Candidatus Bathyarchaeota archaeon]|nr:MAG: DUF1947 domain-containing protein [Candidatus Bathyarchaeota archaeon]
MFSTFLAGLLMLSSCMKDRKFICVTFRFTHMHRIVRRYFPRRKEKKLLLENISRSLGINVEDMFKSRPRVEIVETAKHRIFVFDDCPLIAESEGQLFPTLLFEEYLSDLPKIVVDMGAVPHVCNGANVMAPGIVKIQGTFAAGSLVLVLDERNQKALAVAQALVDSEMAKTSKKGKLFRNLHYVSDDVWNAAKEL